MEIVLAVASIGLLLALFKKKKIVQDLSRLELHKKLREKHQTVVQKSSVNTLDNDIQDVKNAFDSKKIKSYSVNFSYDLEQDKIDSEIEYIR